MSEPGKERYYNCAVAGVLIMLFAGPIVLGVDAISLPPDQRVLTSAQQQLKERVSFTCRDLPIDTVLMQLADQAGVDIIKSPGVKGNITVKITDVPLDEALNNILAAHGWTYVASENIIRVMKLADVDTAKEKLATSIYQITYANVEDVAKALKDYISSKGNIAFNKGTNHIIITDSDQKIKSIDRFIAQIDRQTPQVMVEAKIYDITTTEDFEIGVEWAASRNTPLRTVTRETEYGRDDELLSPEDYTEIDRTWDDQAQYDQHLDYLAGDQWWYSAIRSS
jgi:type II secretory pathway component GspD/PulD (secretin)